MHDNMGLHQKDKLVIWLNALKECIHFLLFMFADSVPHQYVKCSIQACNVGFKSENILQVVVCALDSIQGIHELLFHLSWSIIVVVKACITFFPSFNFS